MIHAFFLKLQSISFSIEDFQPNARPTECDKGMIENYITAKNILFSTKRTGTE